MKILRPCPSCRRDNSASDESCSSCGAPLTAWASEADRRPVVTTRLVPGSRRLPVGLALAALALISAWLLLRDRAEDPEAARASWRRPESVAAWAADRFALRGSPVEAARAVVETRTSRPRRLLLTAHAADADPAAIVRSAAEVLLAAREGGERLLIHAALLEYGPATERRSLLLPASEAAAVLTDPGLLASLVASARRGGLAALEGVGQPASRQPPDSPPEPGADEADADEPRAPNAESASAAAESVSESADSSEASDRLDPVDALPTAPVGVDRGEGGTALPARTHSLDLAQADADAAAVERKPMPVSVLKGAGPRVARSYEAGERQVVLLRAWLHPRTKRPLILKSVTVQPIGSLNDVEGVDFVYLVHDRNGNGLRDATDEQIGDVVSFEDDDAPAVFSGLDFSFGADGGLAKLLVLVDFLDRNQGGDIMLTIPSPDGIVVEEVASGSRVRVDGLAFKSTMTTLNGDLEPAPSPPGLDEGAE